MLTPSKFLPLARPPSQRVFGLKYRAVTFETRGVLRRRVDRCVAGRVCVRESRSGRFWSPASIDRVTRARVAPRP